MQNITSALPGQRSYNHGYFFVFHQKRPNIQDISICIIQYKTDNSVFRSFQHIKPET